MIDTTNLPAKIIKLSKLKDKNGKFKYDDSSKQFAMSVSMQYDILKRSIDKKGQIDPIYIYRYTIVDGRNRVKALNELGITEVSAIKLPHMCTLKERMELANDKEYDKRIATPTQLACNAVKAYHGFKEAGEKVKQADILKKIPASTTNFTAANYIYKHQPDIFERLFTGERIELYHDNKKKKTDSLTAIMNFYKQQQKEMDNSKDNQDREEELAREQLDNRSEDEEINRNGKMEAYRAIDGTLDLIIQNFGASHGITPKDYAYYFFSRIKKAEEEASDKNKDKGKIANFKKKETTENKGT